MLFRPASSALPLVALATLLLLPQTHAATSANGTKPHLIFAMIDDDVSYTFCANVDVFAGELDARGFARCIFCLEGPILFVLILLFYDLGARRTVKGALSVRTDLRLPAGLHAVEAPTYGARGPLFLRECGA